MSSIDINAVAQQATTAVSTAFANLHAPTESPRAFDIFALLGACLCVCFALDFIIASRFGKQRYYALHVLMNMGIVYHCVKDMIRSPTTMHQHHTEV